MAAERVTHAIRDVVAERVRQIHGEGWTPEHDDAEHGRGELALAAGCYALAAGGVDDRWTAQYWPFLRRWWKRADPRRMLVKAAALIIAEIERLDRAAGTGGPDAPETIEMAAETGENRSRRRQIMTAALSARPAQAVASDAIGIDLGSEDASSLGMSLPPMASIRPEVARPLSEWHEDMGDCLWWFFPVSEAPYVGSPLDCGRTCEITLRLVGEEHTHHVTIGGWPGYHTHFTPLPPIPVSPTPSAEASR